MSICEKIACTFPLSGPSAPLTLDSNDSEGRRLRKFLLGKRWNEVQPIEYEQALIGQTISCLTLDAFLYYLPGMLCSLLENKDMYETAGALGFLFSYADYVNDVKARVSNLQFALIKEALSEAAHFYPVHLKDIPI